MMKKKKLSLSKRRNRNGFFFSLHWIIGMILFFLVPLVTSIAYSLSDVSLTNEGVQTVFVGIEHFKYLLVEDVQYLERLRDAISSMLTSLPIIIALSLFLALILNGNFKGRIIFRGIYFLPVILAGSVVMDILQSPIVNVPLFTQTSGESTNYGSMIDFNSILANLDLPQAITDLFSEYLSSIFNLIWLCGVPTLLFLAGLQSIERQLYEVGKVEGANRWEMLWKVEIPMLRNIITVVLIYTMIDLFTSPSNPMMEIIQSAMFNNQLYDRSSAMLWGYFICVGGTMALVLYVYNKYCVKRWE